MTIWRMRIAYYTTKSTNTRSEYVIILLFHCNSGCANAIECHVISTLRVLCVILFFRHGVDENCVLLGCYAASNDNSFPTFRDNLSLPSSRVKDGTDRTLEEGSDRLSRKINKITSTSCVTTQKKAFLFACRRVYPKYSGLTL
jgi:hypothetical protein